MGERMIRNVPTLARWLISGSRVAHFGRPRRIDRHVQVADKVQIGKGAVIGANVKIEGPIVIGEDVTIETGALLLGNIKIGSRTHIGRHTYLGTGPAGELSIGADVLVNDFSTIGAFSSITIGDHCIFAPYAQITDSEHGLDRDTHIKHAPIRSEAVRIGDGVWLGSHVVVLMGSLIGARTAIGAHSLVNSEIAGDSVAYGIPARARRPR